MESPRSPAVHVLHVDDDERILELVQTRLEREFDRLHVETTTSVDDAIDALDDDVDCIVTDYRMPGDDGLDLLKRIRVADPHVPVVFFTGHGSEEIAADAISAGVTDYLQKGADESTVALLGNRVLSLVDRRRADEAARDADRRVREVYERINEAFLGLGREWEVTYVNDRVEELLDVVEDDVVGEEAWFVLPGLDGEFRERVEAAREAQEPATFEFEYPAEDRWFEVAAYPSEDGVSVFLADTTDEHAAKRAVAALSKELDTATSQFRQLQSRIARPPRKF
ncbi:response regulator [Halorubellus salinus]|uniref:response regulator n=1 Tax=Halorubellus salinus TaxID=755309 RepID=UPI001D08918C|nr:response regulator [Halorubellus salinus]